MAAVRLRRPILLVALAAIGCSAPPALAPQPAPNAQAEPRSAAGRALVQLLDAINSGDTARVARYAAGTYHPRYLSESGGVPRAVQRWAEIHTQFGPLEIDSLIPVGETQARAWLRGRLVPAWIDLRVFVDSAAPHQVTRIGLGRGIRPPFADERRPRVSAAELPAHLDGFLRELSGAGRFSGSVAVWRGGRPLFERGYGMADREAGVANTVRTRFDVASVGKVFTAVAVLQLAEQGRVELDAPVGRYVPGLPPQLGTRITVAQLLEHSSGLGEIGAGLDSVMSTARTVADMVRHLTDTAVASPPGARFAYSNRGYLLLGAVVEGASGEDFYSYVHDRVFRRAGMEDTGFFPRDRSLARRAVPYTRFPDPRGGFVPGPARASTHAMTWRGGPVGGAYSTVRDLVRFGDALLGGRLVSGASLARMTQGRPGHPWGYGFGVGGEAGAFGHRGSTPGGNAHFWVYPGSNTIVAVLSNDDWGANLVGDYLAELIPQWPPAAPGERAP